MNFVDAIVNYFKSNNAKDAVPGGYCPNCWGHQEYAGRFLQKLNEEKIDLNNIGDKRGWIQEHAVKYFEGIKLKETTDLFECQNCKLTYPKH